MDDFAVHLTTTDTKKKLSVGQDIIEFLSQPDNSVDCEDLGAFIDGLVPWMQSSNFKVSPVGFIFKCCDGNGIFFRKLFSPNVRKNCPSDEEKKTFFRIVNGQD